MTKLATLFLTKHCVLNKFLRCPSSFDASNILYNTKVTLSSNSSLANSTPAYSSSSILDCSLSSSNSLSFAIATTLLDGQTFDCDLFHYTDNKYLPLGRCLTLLHIVRAARPVITRIGISVCYTFSLAGF